jgi:predicted nucleic acid-binding Zn ribbon protein
MGRWSEGTRLCAMCGRTIRETDDFCSDACERAYEAEEAEDLAREAWLLSIAPLLEFPPDPDGNRVESEATTKRDRGAPTPGPMARKG